MSQPIFCFMEAGKGLFPITYQVILNSLNVFSETSLWEENADRYMQKDELIRLIDQLFTESNAKSKFIRLVV